MVFEQKTTKNKVFLLKKLVNMKLKEGTLWQITWMLLKVL